jgi:hypothetical protein
MGGVRMRAFSLSIGIGVLLIGVAAQADPKATEVEVTNGPQSPVPVVGQVEVTNPSAPARFQLVGFTSTTYTGNLGGYFGAAAKCQVEFPRARMCTLAEVALTSDVPADLSGEAWALIYPTGSTTSGVLPSSNNCLAYQVEVYPVWSYMRGAVVAANGSGPTPATTGWYERDCSQSAQIACCALR